MLELYPETVDCANGSTQDDSSTSECAYDQEERRYSEAREIAMRLTPEQRLRLARDLEIEDPAFQQWSDEQNALAAVANDGDCPF